MRSFRLKLLVSVSVVGILAADPMSARAQVRAVTPPPVWVWWFEGGGTNLSGPGSYIAGFSDPGVNPGSSGVGWEIAAGFDRRLDNPLWHLSGQVRYGRNRIASRRVGPTAAFFGTTDGYTSSQFVAGNGTVQRREQHWLVDFMVGREMNLGLGETQLKGGFRVASIRGTTTGDVTWNVPLNPFQTPTAVQGVTFEQNNNFLGWGPRFAFGGTIPFTGKWSFDFDVGAALLFSGRNLSQTVNFYGPNGNPCLSGCPINVTSSSAGAVFNFDAQPGISYAYSRDVKISVSYRFDGYWNAMRVADVNGQFSNASRIFQGGFLRLTYVP